MKTLLRSVLFFGASTVLLSGCEATDTTKHGKAPETIGNISLDRTHIGSEQTLTATCELPTGAEHPPIQIRMGDE